MLLERALVHTAASRACDAIKNPTAAKHHHQRAIELLATVEADLREGISTARKWVDKRVAHLTPGHDKIRPTLIPHSRARRS
jgi:hypothetical protein